MSKKKMILREVSQVHPYELELSLHAIKAYVDALIAEHGSDAFLEWDRHYHEAYSESPSPRFILKQHFLETDEELAKRLLSESDQKSAKIARDLAELERLQNLYGKK